ncbi:MAG: hypothetical protein DRN47_03985, partial [Candidatus Wolframiiraptor sp.]
MKIPEVIWKRAKEKKKRFVLPESSDERILKAASIAASEGLGTPVLLGEPSEIR